VNTKTIEKFHKQLEKLFGTLNKYLHLPYKDSKKTICPTCDRPVTLLESAEVKNKEDTVLIKAYSGICAACGSHLWLFVVE